MDLFSRTVSGCSNGASEKQNCAQGKCTAQAWIRLRVRDWRCTSQYQQGHVVFPAPSHVFSSTSSMTPVFSMQFSQLRDSKLSLWFSALSSVASPNICREMLIQLHISTWVFKLTDSSWLSRTLIEFGLLSYFHYLTQSIYQLNAETQSQPHKTSYVIFDSDYLGEEFLNPIWRETNFQKKWRSDCCGATCKNLGHLSRVYPAQTKLASNLESKKVIPRCQLDKKREYSLGWQSWTCIFDLSQQPQAQR